MTELLFWENAILILKCHSIFEIYYVNHKVYIDNARVNWKIFFGLKFMIFDSVFTMRFRYSKQLLISENTSNIFQWKISFVYSLHQYSEPVRTVQTATKKRAYADLHNSMTLYERKRTICFAFALTNILMLKESIFLLRITNNH